MMIYIVIPVFNRIEFTLRCLQSLRQQSHRDFRVVVVDDGSTDGTGSCLRRLHPEVEVLEGGGDLWWTGATNLGVQYALANSGSDTDFVLTLNNDLVVGEDYLESLLRASHSYPKALIGSVSVPINEPDTIHFAGTRWNARTARYRPALAQPMRYAELRAFTDTVSTDLLPGRGILVPVTAYRALGLYDGAAFPHYMADEDFSLRARAAGYRLLIATGAVVYNHVEETGLRKQKRDLKYYRAVFTSRRSPVNLRNRWNWARRHAAIFPPIYFAADYCRILKSLLFR